MTATFSTQNEKPDNTGLTDREKLHLRLARGSLANAQASMMRQKKWQDVQEVIARIEEMLGYKS